MSAIEQREGGELETVAFTACAHLDFDRTRYVPSVQMNLITHYGTTKVTWNRRDPDGNLQLCQFCTKRGRINSATGCLSADEAHCSDYEFAQHIVFLSDIDTE